MRRAKLTATSALLCILALCSAERAFGQIEIILDASGSMRGRAGNQNKMDAAKEAIRNTLRAMGREQQVALRVYGHRVHRDSKEESCQDTELVIPFGTLNRASLVVAVDAVQPLGQTPLALTLERAAGDFRGDTGGSPAIILVSDGEETCGGDPVAVACELAERGIALTIHTIGFGVESETRAQLQAIAQCGGGQYRDAENAEELAHSLRQVVRNEPEVDEFHPAVDIGWNGLAFHGGVTVPFDYDVGFALGAWGDLGKLWMFRLHPGIYYTRTTGEKFGVDFDSKVFSVGAEVRYYLEPGSTSWYFGGGPYLHFLDFGAGEQYIQGGTRPALEGVAGFQANEHFGVEARLTGIGLSQFRGATVLASWSF